jgi:hypothetical protein
LVGEPQGKRLPGTRGHRREDIEIDHKEKGGGGRFWTGLDLPGS